MAKAAKKKSANKASNTFHVVVGVPIQTNFKRIPKKEGAFQKELTRLRKEADNKRIAYNKAFATLAFSARFAAYDNGTITDKQVAAKEMEWKEAEKKYQDFFISGFSETNFEHLDLDQLDKLLDKILKDK